jgi:8-oxo-dGTP pyrophosphatase MutT (NUDIX family)
VESGLTVRAAGGVVWRRDSSGALEVLVVHRPRYDDWTLPKGKLLPGERDEEAAVREVEEETGLRGELGGELPSSTYHDQQGRLKVVRFWAMRSLGGDFRPHDEVDKARWLPLTEAPDALSYPGDRAVLAALADALG